MGKKGAEKTAGLTAMYTWLEYVKRCRDPGVMIAQEWYLCDDGVSLSPLKCNSSSSGFVNLRPDHVPNLNAERQRKLSHQKPC